MSSARGCSAAEDGGGEELGDDEDDNSPPLFVDGIVVSVSYYRIRDLFALLGKLRNVFVQRSRNQGRKQRFGFVRFFSRVNATAALEALNGIKVGGSVLRVAWARFPFQAGAVASKFRANVLESAKGSGVEVINGEGGANHSSVSFSGRQRSQVQKEKNEPKASSWRDVVLGKLPSQVVPRDCAGSRDAAHREKGVEVFSMAPPVCVCRCRD